MHHMTYHTVPTRLLLAAACTAVLVGCASGPPPAGAPLPATPGAPGSRPVDAGLAAEERWLSQLFAGTPVRIALQRDGALGVEVPLDFSFDAGATRIKPPLAKVLDYVAQSGHRQRAVRVAVAAPPDARGTPALALRRAAALRAYLSGKGIAPQRLAEPQAADGERVVVRLEPAPG
jgi:outer membrane protein OmpA-like peptidoglycan-associated protein